MKRQKIILIVGPSGVGKTTACQSVQQRSPNCVAQPLDVLASNWAVELGMLTEASVNQLRNHLKDDQAFLKFGLDSIGVLASRRSDMHLVIDVGAGFQDAQSAVELHRAHDVILITAEPSVVFSRIRSRPEEHRTVETYMAQEFSKHRLRVYSQAPYPIDTTSLVLQEAADKLASILRQLIPD